MGEGGTGWRQEKGFLVKEEMVRPASVRTGDVDSEGREMLHPLE